MYMNIDKSKGVWDIDNSSLYEDLLYSFHVAEVNILNINLYEKNSDVRAAYSTQKEFIYYVKINKNGYYNDIIKKSMFIDRRHKINKILKNVFKD